MSRICQAKSFAAMRALFVAAAAGVASVLVPVECAWDNG
jgi:hypothetical protein